MPTSLYVRLYWAFVGSFCALGVCIAFAQPIFSVPDEDTHWIAGHVRAEQLVNRKSCVPTFVLEGTRRRHQPLPPFAEMRHTPLTCLADDQHLYGDLLTYPGVLMSKVLLPRQHSAFRQMQAILLTRMLQGLLLAVCLVRLGVLASRAPRPGPLLVGAFALSPLLVQQAFAVSADGAQLCFGVCLFSAIVFWDQWGWQDLALFVGLGWGATAKPFLVTCAIPSVIAGYWYARLRAPQAQGARSILASMLRTLKPSRRPSLESLALYSAILLSAVTVMVALSELGSGDDSPGKAGVDVHAQLAAIGVQPWRFLAATANQVPKPWLLRNYAGPLGWLDAPLAPASVHTFMWLVGLGSLLEIAFLVGPWWRRSAGWSFRSLTQRATRAALPLLMGLATVVANVFFVTLVLYLVWTPVGASRVEGMQMRYFLPTVIVLIGVVCGAAGVVLQAPAPAQLDTAPAPLANARLQKVLAGLSQAAPLLIMALTLPYIARVFLDLARRYQ